MPEVLVPTARWVRWVENFERSHGAARFDVVDGALQGVADDGSRAVVQLPFDRVYAGDPDPGALLADVAPPSAWAVLLVRRGGFAVARLSGERLTASKVGQRHVQGRTKAGGQSQQRFARRRANQARQAFDAATEHAARLLAELPPGELPLVSGGDRAAVRAVLDELAVELPRLRLRPVGPWLAVADPRRAVLDQAVLDAQSLRVLVDNAEPV